MKKEQQFAGILLGLVQGNEGKVYIAIDINGNRLAMDVNHAALVFDQLGGLLEELGYFDEEEVAPTCH